MEIRSVSDGLYRLMVAQENEERLKADLKREQAKVAGILDRLARKFPAGETLVKVGDKLVQVTRSGRHVAVRRVEAVPAYQFDADDDAPDVIPAEAVTDMSANWDLVPAGANQSVVVTESDSDSDLF